MINKTRPLFVNPIALSFLKKYSFEIIIFVPQSTTKLSIFHPVSHLQTALKVSTVIQNQLSKIIE